MGQAFDSSGRVLGEAEGATKREVFDELERKHPTAHEIRVQSLRDKLPITGGPVDVPGMSRPAPVEHILQFFEFQHLPVHLQQISKPFAALALVICDTLPRNPERTVALRKLLEAKDAAVRAAIAQ